MWCITQITGSRMCKPIWQSLLRLISFNLGSGQCLFSIIMARRSLRNRKSPTTTIYGRLHLSSHGCRQIHRPRLSQRNQSCRTRFRSRIQTLRSAWKGLIPQVPPAQQLLPPAKKGYLSWRPQPLLSLCQRTMLWTTHSFQKAPHLRLMKQRRLTFLMFNWILQPRDRRLPQEPENEEFRRGHQWLKTSYRLTRCP